MESDKIYNMDGLESDKIYNIDCLEDEVSPDNTGKQQTERGNKQSKIKQKISATWKSLTT